MNIAIAIVNTVFGNNFIITKPAKPIISVEKVKFLLFTKKFLMWYCFVKCKYANSKIIIVASETNEPIAAPMA